MTLLSASATLDRLATGNRASFWRLARHAGLECLSAHFRRHQFPLHAHETYVMGAIVQGVHVYSQSGITIQAGPGQLCFINPGELHDGSTKQQGYEYRMIYPSVALVQMMLEQETGRPRGTPSFRNAVLQDQAVARQFIATHAALQVPELALAADEELLRLFLLLLARNGDGEVVVTRAGHEPRMVTLVKDYLAQHFEEKIELRHLAELTGNSPFHLIRAFRKATGLTPAQWLTDRRIQQACHLLRQGLMVGDVAAACGFFDQSHFTRNFKARLGITPMQFRA